MHVEDKESDRSVTAAESGAGGASDTTRGDAQAGTDGGRGVPTPPAPPAAAAAREGGGGDDAEGDGTSDGRGTEGTAVRPENRQPPPGGDSVVPPPRAPLRNQTREELRHIIQRKQGAYGRRAWAWGVCYQFSLYASAALAAASALALKLDSLAGWQYRNDFSAVAAGLAAFIIILTAAGGFHRRWRVNRAAEQEMFRQTIELTKEDADGDEIRRSIDETVRKYEERVVGPDIR